MIKDKKQISAVIIIFILVLVLGIVSYAFFNYTKTSNMNNVTVGRINFQSSQNNTINLTNVFPTDSAHLDSTNSSTVTINISGDTDYDKGIEYKVSIVEVENTVNNKEIPISFNVTASNLGTKSNDYYNERGSTSNVFNLLESGLAENDTEILIGYIKPDENGINGSINITAYIDRDNIGISDTVSRIENNNLVYGETPGDWIDGRTILTTTEWNSLFSEGISFKVKVEAIEGTWSQQTEYYVLKNLYDIQEWANIMADITSVEFHTDGVAPANPIATIDATDLTSAGPVKVYTIDDGLGNNTYKALVVANDTIYAPNNSTRMFRDMSKLVTFNSENFKVDNVTNMQQMFQHCTNLVNIDSLLSWNTANVTNMMAMFMECTSLVNVNALKNFNTSNVGTNKMYGLFNGCTKLINVDGLINWNISNLTDMGWMFKGCTSLRNVNGLINWDISHVTSMNQTFNGCSSLINVDGLKNWNTSMVNNMDHLFNECTSLQNINGLKNWNTSSVQNMQAMFNYCVNLKTIDLSSWNMASVTSNRLMFQNDEFTTLIMPNNYKRIDNFMFNHNSSYNGSSFTIPKSVTTIGNTHVFYNFGKDGVFNKFIVESGSTSFKTINDILYTYDGTRLISIPIGKTFANNTYEMPEGVTTLNALSFSSNQKIDKVILANSYTISRLIDEAGNKGNTLSLAIYGFTSVKEYEVKNDNPRYSSNNGCIYSKDGTELIAVPLHYNGVLNIKSGTTTIGQEAFWTYADMIQFIDSITQINIPASVTTIEANQLTVLNRLMSRSTNPVTITIDSGNTSYRISNNQIVAI